ncbi:MAG: hypothetical protein R3A79_22675 [Nannocystaceae bacterium]
MILTSRLRPRHAGLPLALALVAVPVACTGGGATSEGESDATSTTKTTSSTSDSASTGSSTTATTAETTTTTTTATATTTETTDTSETSTGTTGEPLPSDAVDILLVIDDSGSMSEEQALLSASLGALIEPLEAASIDYRIAITTTDAGNPRCPKAATTPPNGAFVLSSCVDRVEAGDFLFEGVDPPFDASYACTDYCSASDDAIVVTPTPTALDPEAKPRPWIEGGPGGSNISGLSQVAALQCFVPQGITGCGFESPLEAMYKALTRATTPGEANYGFLRDDASLLVLIITDETDCSYNPAHEEVFTTNKALWNSPADPVPTSAVCWRAGVGCSGSSPSYDDCFPEHHTVDAAVTDSEQDAVLFPLSRYSDQLHQIADAKLAGKVELRLIAGVPSGYIDGAAIPYTESDPNYISDFGIDPACVSDFGRAVPSVRERALAEELSGGARTTHSICESDFGVALDAAAKSVIGDP